MIHIRQSICKYFQFIADITDESSLSSYFPFAILSWDNKSLGYKNKTSSVGSNNCFMASDSTLSGRLNEWHRNRIRIKASKHGGNCAVITYRKLTRCEWVQLVNGIENGKCVNANIENGQSLQRQIERGRQTKRMGGEGRGWQKDERWDISKILKIRPKVMPFAIPCSHNHKQGTTNRTTRTASSGRTRNRNRAQQHNVRVLKGAIN